MPGPIKSYLERFSDAEVDRDAIAASVAVVSVSPRRADGRGEAREEAGDGVSRQLRAERRLDLGSLVRPRPCFSGVGEDRGVHGVQEQRPRPMAALRTRNRPAILEVAERDMAARERIRGEAAQKRERGGVEIADAVSRRAA